MGCSSSYKGGKELFFVVRPTKPFDILAMWTYELLARFHLSRYKEKEDYKTAVWVLGS